MAKVIDVIKMLSNLDPNEEIALTGWWIQSDVEHNNDLTFTEDEWQLVVDKHEDNIEIHIDDVVSMFLRDEL